MASRSWRWSPGLLSGQRGSACAASAWRTCGAANLYVQVAQLHVHVNFCAPGGPSGLGKKA
eukprot:14056053-Alexandrium_andersonii.AAC.1